MPGVGPSTLDNFHFTSIGCMPHTPQLHSLDNAEERLENMIIHGQYPFYPCSHSTSIAHVEVAESPPLSNILFGIGV